MMGAESRGQMWWATNLGPVPAKEKPLDTTTSTLLIMLTAVSLVLCSIAGLGAACACGEAKDAATMPRRARLALGILGFSLFENHLTNFCIVPASYGLSQDMGGDAFVSGWLVSSFSLGGLAGTLIAKWLVHGAAWQLARVRHHAMMMVLVAAVASTLFAASAWPVIPIINGVRMAL